MIMSKKQDIKPRFGAWLKKKSKRYIYGIVKRPDGTERNPARLDTKTGRVQFILWKAGEQNHKEDFWYNMGYGWENHFKPND